MTQAGEEPRRWTVETLWSDERKTGVGHDTIAEAGLDGRRTWCCAGSVWVRVIGPEGELAYTIGPDDSNWLAHSDAARAHESELNADIIRGLFGRGCPAAAVEHNEPMYGPVLYLDVDGVLMPARFDIVVEHATPHRYVLKLTESGAPQGDFDDWTGSGIDVFSPSMLEALVATGATPVWCTTWGIEANAHLSPLFGWPPLRTLERADSIDRWWKLDQVLADQQAQPRPFIWADDQIASETDQGDRAQLDALGVPYLLVCPDPLTGLSKDEIAQIKAFCAEVRS